METASFYNAVRLSLSEQSAAATNRMVTELLDLWNKEHYRAVKNVLTVIDPAVAREWIRELAERLPNELKRAAFFNYINFSGRESA